MGFKEARADKQELQAQMDALRSLFEGNSVSAASRATAPAVASGRDGAAQLPSPSPTQQTGGGSKRRSKATVADTQGGRQPSRSSQSDCQGVSAAESPTQTAADTASITTEGQVVPEVQVEAAKVPPVKELVCSQQTEVTDVSRRVDQLQQQLGTLQAWMLQGSQLLSLNNSK